MPINQMVSRHHVGSDGEVPVHRHHCFTVRLPASAYPTTADASKLLPVFPVSFAEADHHMGRRRQSNRKHNSRDQSLKWGAGHERA